MKWSRRQFLKATGFTGLTAVANGCSDASRRLIPFLNEPEDIVPGNATWYATTCRECPAGCGMLAKTREGRVIKVEGNPLHPVNTGKLCARGQASVQGIYNPDRYRAPLRRGKDGSSTAISWSNARNEVLTAVRSAVARGNDRVALVSDLTTGAERALIRRFLAACNSSDHLVYEPLGYGALKAANQEIFGSASIPGYRIDEADLLISLSADFLETWISNVQFARQFARFREPRDSARKAFVYVGPRLSMTGASADTWIPVPPGGQSIFAFGLLRLLLEKKDFPGLTQGLAGQLRSSLSAFTPGFVLEKTGVSEETLRAVSSHFLAARRPVIIAEGNGYQDTSPLDAARAADLLSSLMPGSMGTMDFSNPSSLTDVSTDSVMEGLAAKMETGAVDVLFILRANPAYHMPTGSRFLQAMDRVKLVVSLSSFPDETGRKAHLVFPTHTFLESWGDFGPYPTVHGLLQPVTRPVFDTGDPGDILLTLGRDLKGLQAFPEKDFYQVVRQSWETHSKEEASREPARNWVSALQQGGSWSAPPGERAGATRKTGAAKLPDLSPPPASRARTVYSLVTYPTVQFFDGRTANRPFLQELPDPITAATWGGWVEIHPETARHFGARKGDVLTVDTESGPIKAAAYLYRGIAEGTLALPMSHFHPDFGRYAATARQESGAAGRMTKAVTGVTVTRNGQVSTIAHTDGSDDQHGRDLARAIGWETHQTSRGAPDVILPLPQGFSREKDFYPPHHHDTYRWAMAVDLDRCIGCGACVVACYAENNIATVGREQVLKGREMAWLHVQRYFEREQPFVRFLPMMCQHCDEAPCEPVCPVFAPQHSKEGINNQVYNRCIGTRYCNQNCPYKVRRFNWLDWKWEQPLEQQLNPDLTVRSKGVMEKCSFCIQRIVEAKIRARSENRLVRDGDFTTACAQTCPTDALTFGNLLDPDSRVSKLIMQSRAYQVLGSLNTKPAVIYLKKITRRLV